MINKINNAPTFASKVYISAYAGASNKQREFLTSKPVLDELHILQNNENNDIVTIIPAAKTDDIFMSVTVQNNDKKKTTETIIFDPEDIPAYYKIMNTQLQIKKYPAIPDSIVDFII